MLSQLSAKNRHKCCCTHSSTRRIWCVCFIKLAAKYVVHAASTNTTVCVEKCTEWDQTRHFLFVVVTCSLRNSAWGLHNGAWSLHLSKLPKQPVQDTKKKPFDKTHTPIKARRTEIRTRDSRVKVLRADHYTMQRIAVRRESPQSRPVGVLATTRLLPTGKRPYNMDVLVIIPHCTHTHPVNEAPNGTEPWQVYCAGAGLSIGG